MNYTVLLGIVALVAAVFVVKSMGQVSAQTARKLLQEGAYFVDVRSHSEFNAQHLPQTVNIPLDELSQRLPKLMPDQNRVLLLHCLSGTRSAIAKRVLKGMGYRNVFNLGSIGRARRILSA